MPTNPMRAEMLRDPRFDLDRWARSRGFPNARALEAVLAAGVALKTEGRITAEALRAVVASYGPGMAQTIRGEAARISGIAEKWGRHNAAAELIAVVAGRDAVEGGRRLIDNYHDTQIADGVMERRARGDAPKVAQRPEDPSSVRANIKRALAVKTDKPPTEVLADAAEKTINRKETLNAAPELFSLREHLSVNYDDLAVTAELDGIDDAGALDDGFAPPGESR